MHTVLLVALALTAAAVGGLTTTPTDYLYTPANNPNPAETAFYLAYQQTEIGYQQLPTTTLYVEGVTVPLTFYPAPLFAQNITMPTGLVGSYMIQSSFDALEISSGPVAAQMAIYNAAVLASGMTFPTLASYANLYSDSGFWPVPLGLNGWSTDEHFERLRRTYYPLVIQQTKAADLSLLDGHISALEQATLVVLADLGQLYHEPIKAYLQAKGLLTPPVSCKSGTVPDFVLFQTDPATLLLPVAQQKLLPVGILVGGDWVTPNDPNPWAWMLAKIAANSIDSNLMPMTHFFDTHIMDAPVRNAMVRQMDPNSPAFAAQKPISDYQNGLFAAGFLALFNPGTGYDQLATFGGLGMHAYINNEWAARPWTDRYMAADFAARGVTHMPGYVYGEDMQAWDSLLRGFMTALVNTYYPTDQSVANDPQLKATFAEAGLPVPQGGALYGLPPMTTKQQLIDALTHLELSVVKHHATNLKAFSQAQDALPYAPWLVTCAWPGKASVTETFIVQQCMPNLATASATLNIAYDFDRSFPLAYSMTFKPQLAEVGTKMGAARAAFAAGIAALDATIQARNDPILPFQLLQSSLLPRSLFA